MSTDFPRVVDSGWLTAHLGEPGLVVGDVRGPNAHARGHIPGSRPLVLGSPPPGADVDEYLSLPEYYGDLPPGDVIALGANPTLVARLTGADPLRVREVARTAASPSELPPAGDLYAQIAELMGVTV